MKQKLLTKVKRKSEKKLKKRSLCYLITAILLLFCLIYTDFSSSATVQAASNVTQKTMYIGNTYTLKINGKVQYGKWTSSKKEVAAVSNRGRITAKKRGQTVITAQIGKKKYRCVINVKQPVTRISLNKSSIKLGRGAQETLKAKVYPSSADNKKITWKSTDTKVAKVSQKGVITPTGDGYCEIQVIAADRKKVLANCYVYVENCSPPVIQKSKYSYELYLIDGLGADGWYEGIERPIYIKTDNPDINSISWKNFYGIWGLNGDPGGFNDVDYTAENAIGDVVKVDGGYLIDAGFENEGNVLFGACGGIGTMNILENGKIVASFSCNVKDYNTEADKAIADIISRAVTDNMTPFEKMQAVCDYFEKKNPRYLPNDGIYLLTLASAPVDPWWKSWRFDSLTTPTILCKIAKQIGGFDKVENGYSKYYGTSQWGSKHWYAEVTVGSETRSYTFCPMSGTGIVDSVPKVNFRDTSKFIRIY